MREMARVPSRVAPAVARDISREIQRSMDASKDPYGRPWKIKANGKRSKLLRTGRGRASILVRAARGAGFQITVGVLYMIYHQFGGASHLRGPGGSYRLRKKNKNFGRDKDRSSGRNKPPQRMFLPFDRLPDSWGAIILARLEAMGQKVIDNG
jgi:phage gpG-like protein